MCRLGALAAIVAAAVAACGQPATAERTVRMPSPAGVSLVPRPVEVSAACARAGTIGFPVLCPARWPATDSRRPAAVRWLVRAPGAYLLNAFIGLDDRSPHVFHLLVGGQRQPFAADWQPLDSRLRVTTRAIRIPMRAGGTFLQQLPARRIGTTVVDGSPALLLREPDYPTGGLQGGHVLVLWNLAGHGYLVSVHGTSGTTQAGLIRVAVALARSAAPP